MQPRCSRDAAESGATSAAPQAAAVARATLAALAALHAIGVCHNDVKPQNLLFCLPPRAGATSLVEVAGGAANGPVVATLRLVHDDPSDSTHAVSSTRQRTPRPSRWTPPG